MIIALNTEGGKMQAMTRISLAVLLIGIATLFLVNTADAERPRPLGWAMDAVRTENWENAARLAHMDGPVAQDIVEWHRLRAGLGNYQQVVRFLERRPDWPGEALLRRRSEPAILDAGPEATRAFFAEAHPITPQGVLGYARALERNGQREAAAEVIADAWRAMPMDQVEHTLFVQRYGDMLSGSHIARLDAMLWAGADESARRMIPLLPSEYQALARARLALQAQTSEVNRLIDLVPSAQAEDPGLAHDRFEWRLRAGNWASAKDLIIEQSAKPGGLWRAQAWANRRRALARDEMRDGSPARAYRIASEHGLESGAAYADLEWLSGYIALQYRNDPAQALRHFENHRAAVASPISRGRAGYWIGRAYEALGASDLAHASYREGAQFQTSFYGLLAAERAGLSTDAALNGAEDFGNWRQAEFTQSDLFEAGLLLQASGELDLAERFWLHLADRLDRNGLGQLGQAAIELGHPHLAVMIGKKAAQRGWTIHAPYYALHPVAEMGLVMAPEMLLAIARRESEFDPKVRSGAGALGLMQIMPGTGQDIARDMGRSETQHTSRLITDPEYNAELGAAYLQQLAGLYDGNVVLMSIAYNAGPARADRWLALYGDPRDLRDGMDIVDWIEHIPFRETRNYVMRVSESLPVYRARLSAPALPIAFSEELKGATLRAFAKESL